jgi:hypothetical protein
MHNKVVTVATLEKQIREKVAVCQAHRCNGDDGMGGDGVGCSSVEDTIMNRLHFVGLTGTVLSTVNIRPVALFLTTTTSLVSP